MRNIILHYHLFKNAGTSLDAALKKTMATDEWQTREFPPQPAMNRQQLIEWIEDNPQAICFSSHTAILPPPAISHAQVFPVIFMRHPIDRIASAYAFEHKQTDNNGFGAVLARNTTFAGYVETRLSLSFDRQCRNFHADRLAAMYPADEGNELERALKAIDQLPFIGIVEQFNQSLTQLQNKLHQHGLNQIQLNPAAENVSRDISIRLEQKLSAIEQELGNRVYEQLVEANQDDLQLYQHACRKFEQN